MIVYYNVITMVPSFIVSVVIIIMLSNYNAYAGNEAHYNGFTAPTMMEILCALLRTKDDNDERCIQPIWTEGLRRTHL